MINLPGENLLLQGTSNGDLNNHGGRSYALNSAAGSKQNAHILSTSTNKERDHSAGARMDPGLPNQTTVGGTSMSGTMAG